MKTVTPKIREVVVKAYASGIASRKQLAAIFGYHTKLGKWL